MQTKRAELGEEYEPRLSVSSHLIEKMIEVRVRDNGPGIAEENIDRIFNPLFSTREGALGAGLGLPIAADVARRAGGDIVVDTEFGEYAQFTMHLPVMEEVVEPDEVGAPESMAEIVERMSAQT